MNQRFQNFLINIIFVAGIFLFLYLYIKYWCIPMQIFVVLLLFLFVAIMPICRGHESIWIYVLTLFFSMPANIRMAVFIVSERMQSEFTINGIYIYYIAVLVIAILALEEILMGWISRLFWPRQQKAVENRKTDNKVIDFSKLK